jgi:hypothetical protein
MKDPQLPAALGIWRSEPWPELFRRPQKMGFSEIWLRTDEGSRTVLLSALYDVGYFECDTGRSFLNQIQTVELP